PVGAGSSYLHRSWNGVRSRSVVEAEDRANRRPDGSDTANIAIIALRQQWGTFGCDHKLQLVHSGLVQFGASCAVRDSVDGSGVVEISEGDRSSSLVVKRLQHDRFGSGRPGAVRARTSQ